MKTVESSKNTLKLSRNRSQNREMHTPPPAFALAIASRVDGQLRAPGEAPNAPAGHQTRRLPPTEPANSP
jgi:hypothetical protein